MKVKSDWGIVSKTIDAMEWKERVMRLQSRQAKLKACSILWWDFQSDKPYVPTSTTRDFLRLWSSENDLSLSQTSIMLQDIGYPKDVADERASVAKRLNNPACGDEGSRHAVGEQAVFFEIAIQAIKDVRSLVESGVIVNGKIASDWPPNNSNGVVGYRKKCEVAALIEWVSGGAMKQLLEDLGKPMDMDAVLRAIGLSNSTKVEGFKNKPALSAHQSRQVA